MKFFVLNFTAVCCFQPNKNTARGGGGGGGAWGEGRGCPRWNKNETLLERAVIK